MSNLSRFRNLKIKSPVSERKIIRTWRELIELGCYYGYDRVDNAQHAQLAQFKQKFENGTFVVKGEHSDFRKVLDVLY